MKVSRLLFLFAAQIFCLIVPLTGSSQTERLGGVQYTPPTGWVKTAKQGAVVYTVVNKTTNAFCVLTIYEESVSAGNPKQDFADQWKLRVVDTFKVTANPETETKAGLNGWQGTAGGTEVEFSGVRAVAILTVFSGFGKTASVLTIFNDQSYLAQMQAVIDGIKLDKNAIVASASPTQKALDPTLQGSDFLDFDPFPDKPRFQPQEPLTGRLRKTITMADLAGTWEIGGASVMEYISSSTQTQTSVSFGRTKYTIRANGTYQSTSQSRASNTTIRESDNGTILLDGGFVIMRSTPRKNRETRYQFVAFMVQPNGAAIISLILIGDSPPLDGAALKASCGHAHGYITCLNSEEWVRIP